MNHDKAVERFREKFPVDKFYGENYEESSLNKDDIEAFLVTELKAVEDRLEEENKYLAEKIMKERNESISLIEHRRIIAQLKALQEENNGRD